MHMQAREILVLAIKQNHSTVIVVYKTHIRIDAK